MLDSTDTAALQVDGGRPAVADGQALLAGRLTLKDDRVQRLVDGAAAPRRRRHQPLLALELAQHLARQIGPRALHQRRRLAVDEHDLGLGRLLLLLLLPNRRVTMRWMLLLWRWWWRRRPAGQNRRRGGVAGRRQRGLQPAAALQRHALQVVGHGHHDRRAW